MNRVMRVGTAAGRRVVSTATRWEPVIGYSRAVRAGNWIAVTGTIGLNPDGSCPPTAAAQMRQALAIVIAAVEALGAARTDIFRTRMYVTDIALWEEIGRVHAEVFGDVRPATTMVEVSALADPAAFVEVEADAVLAS
ncbi:MAG TPA: RidA family protein [Acidobacteriota bacterium]|nr:RidA family protein [Acidobacteriota bacterium]